MTAVASSRGRRLPAPAGRWWRPLLLAAFAVATIAVLAVYVFPTRTWLDQRSASAETSAQLAELRAERRALEERVAELDSDAEIERVARSEYGLVKPGEEAYAVLPAADQPIELPSMWPFGDIAPGTAPEGSTTAD